MTTLIAELKLTTTTPFIDEISIDIAGRRGHADATEGRGYIPEPWVKESRFCLASYDAGFAGGQTLVAARRLDGSTARRLDRARRGPRLRRAQSSRSPKSQLSEGEFMAAMFDAMRAGKVAVMRMTPEQAEAIRAETPGLEMYSNRFDW